MKGFLVVEPVRIRYTHIRTNVVGGGDHDVADARVGGKGGRQDETGIGFGTVGHHKDSAILATQDGKDAQADAGQVVHRSRIQYVTVQDTVG